jgi:hypothetical protein
MQDEGMKYKPDFPKDAEAADIYIDPKTLSVYILDDQGTWHQVRGPRTWDADNTLEIEIRAKKADEGTSDEG